MSAINYRLIPDKALRPAAYNALFICGFAFSHLPGYRNIKLRNNQ